MDQSAKPVILMFDVGLTGITAMFCAVMGLIYQHGIIFLFLLNLTNGYLIISVLVILSLT